MTLHKRKKIGGIEHGPTGAPPPLRGKQITISWRVEVRLWGAKEERRDDANGVRALLRRLELK